MKLPEIEPVLITVFEKFDNKRWIPIRRYRRYRVPYVDEIEETENRRRSKGTNISRIPCPGCGKVMSRLEINDTHECQGDIGSAQEIEEFNTQKAIERAKTRMDPMSRSLLRKHLSEAEYQQLFEEYKTSL